MLFEASGFSVATIVNSLIAQALERHERKNKLKFSLQSV
jgi:hypothetical protein